MRGADVTQDGLFTYTTLEAMVPAAHPLRPIREILDRALREMDRTFAAMYADSGRDSIPPEQLLRGLILQARRTGSPRTAAIATSGSRSATRSTNASATACCTSTTTPGPERPTATAKKTAPQPSTSGRSIRSHRRRR